MQLFLQLQQILQVRLLSDFCYGDIPFTLPTESSKAALGADEYNLLYVALTRFTLLYTAMNTSSHLLCRAKKNLIINDALFFLLSSRFMSYSFEQLVFTSECLEAACVKCGALTNNMLVEDQPCVSVVQQKVRSESKTFLLPLHIPGKSGSLQVQEGWHPLCTLCLQVCLFSIEWKKFSKLEADF